MRFCLIFFFVFFFKSKHLAQNRRSDKEQGEREKKETMNEI